MMRLKIATYNVWAVKMGPVHISPMIRERMEAIREWMATWDADVICLQEVWCDSLVETLHDPRIFPYRCRGGKRGRLRGRFGDGLVILSRYPVRNFWFTHFHEFTSMEEFWVAKGALAARIETSVGQTIVVNTHLGAGSSIRYMRARLGQIDRLASFVGGLPKVRDLFVTGDFNFAPHSAEYAWLLHTMRTSDGQWVDLGAVQDRPTFDPHRSYAWKTGEREARIDYVFRHVPSGEIPTSIVDTLTSVEMLSDHHPVIADVELVSQKVCLPAVA